MYSSYSVAAAVCSCVFPTLAIIAVGLRLKARLLQKLKLGLDDWLTIAALALAISYCCLVLYGSFNAGIGQDLSTITPDEYANYQKHLYFGVIVAHLSYGFVKLAVLQFYKRIFAVPNFHLYANIIIVVVILFMIAATFTQIFSAWPIYYWWTLGKTYTINYGAFLTSFTAIDLVLDIVILCLPVPVIHSLNMNRNRKFLLLGVFWMGFFCVVATSVRLYFGYKLSEAGSGRPVSDQEFSYVSVNNVIWAQVESCCSVIAGCLPTYGPLIRSSSFSEFVSSVFKSLLKSLKRKSTTWSSKRDQTDAWYPLSENHGNSATVGNSSKVVLTEDDGIHVQRSLDINVQRHNTQV
ncbi:putative integral membrane protein [Eutypa lata UCREL1]|uniref:Putative integral membrane protein n=1 Tax=Eutypa lata (strain UCR-EL1) TaxID=1287681 RepID=M7T3A5_EUTLA|nr:putative integral membrane protein [Eutypa lata UCREL1]